MPDLKSRIHLEMLEQSHKHGRTDEKKIYGIEWGDPNEKWFLKLVRNQFIQPYVNLEHTALEIGPGGGRWTRYLLSFSRLFVLDKHQELLDELAKKFQNPHMVPVLGNGTDIPGIPDSSIDYVFSFGVFVHLDAWIIREYLDSLHRAVSDTANIVIQYSDKTKEEAAREPSFADNDPARMRSMIGKAGFTILEENVTSLPHSAVVRFRKRAEGEKQY